jgi:Flp pilus assembly pilin Flp
MRNALRRFLFNDDAATAVEYAVLLAMILMVIFGSVIAFGAQQKGTWTMIQGRFATYGIAK